MIPSKTIFKSSKSEERWIHLQKEKAELQKKIQTPIIQEKIDIINSLMTSCKIGFNLSEAKVKKISKLIKEKTGKNKVKYGAFPVDLMIQKFPLKDFTVVYVEKDEQIIFREYTIG